VIITANHRAPSAIFIALSKVTGVGEALNAVVTFLTNSHDSPPRARLVENALIESSYGRMPTRV
jgi:hypothetical protein